MIYPEHGLRETRSTREREKVGRGRGGESKGGRRWSDHSGSTITHTKKTEGCHHTPDMPGRREMPTAAGPLHHIAMYLIS